MRHRRHTATSGTAATLQYLFYLQNKYATSGHLEATPPDQFRTRLDINDLNRFPAKRSPGELAPQSVQLADCTLLVVGTGTGTATTPPLPPLSSSHSSTCEMATPLPIRSTTFLRPMRLGLVRRLEMVISDYQTRSCPATIQSSGCLGVGRSRSMAATRQPAAMLRATLSSRWCFALLSQAHAIL